MRHMHHSPKLTLGHTFAWLFPLLPIRLFPVKLKKRELQKHKHVMGVTGGGKSQFLIHMITQLIFQDIPCAVIDPHADLVHDCLALLYDHGYFTKEQGRENVLYVDFTRPDAFVPFNILKQPFSPHTIANNVVEAFKRAYPELAEAPLFTQIMSASIVVLVAHDLPITKLPDLLTKEEFRDQLLEKEGLDEVVVSYFTQEFSRYGRDTAANIGSTLRRVFLTQFTPALRYSLGQTDNLLDFRLLMQEKTSVLLNLGGLDHETKRLIGCFLSVAIEQATLSRADLREDERIPYHIFIDECQIFLSKSEEAFTSLLSEARKYNVTLWLSHQNISQLSERMLGAFQNALPICFQLQHPDSSWGARVFGRYNPAQIRYSQTSEEQTAFESVQGQFELMAQQIEELEPGEAFTKLKRTFGRGSRTICFRTKKMPHVEKKTDKIAELQSHYSKAILRPLERIVPLETGEIQRQKAPVVGRRGHFSLSPHTQPAPPPLPKTRSHVKPLETTYLGYRFRSRTEARWAVFLHTLGIRFDYEQQGFDLDGIWYLPDFWLVQLDCFLEIKGELPTGSERMKANLLCRLTQKPVYVLYGSLPYPENNQPSKDMEESQSALGFLWDPTRRDVSIDSPYWFCQCFHCQHIGLAYRGDASLLSCRCVASATITVGTPSLFHAYAAARAARF
jgi:hypothetical protein